MTMWSEENKDAMGVSSDQAALGPRVGFLDRWATSWDAQSRASAAFGIEDSFRDEEAQQIRSLKEAGVENIPSLAPYAHGFASDYSIGPVYGTKNYLTISRFYARGGDEGVANFVNEYDNRVDELKKKFPNLNLRTSREMFDTVVAKAQKAESDLANQRTTAMGDVGGFLGGAVAGMNPRTDPLNFMSLGAGGPGKNVLMRIGAQAGIQGVTEGVNQITGVQEERAILGLEHGFGDAVSRVAGAAVGGAAVQGIGEGIGAGIKAAGKRWFRNTEIDPAPTIVPEEKPMLLLEGPKYSNRPEWSGQAAWEADVKDYQQQVVRDLINGTRSYTEELHPLSPYSNTRMGKARTAMDLDYMTSRLEAWDGEAPHIVPPRTETAIPRVINDFTTPEVKFDIHNPGKTLDTMAREFDPSTFRVYDDLAKRVSTYRQWLQDMHPEGVARREKLQAQIDDLDTKMQNLSYNMSKVGSRRRGEMQVKMDALKAQRDGLHEDMRSFDTPDMARIREELIADDNKMRDMAPIVGRAYAAAQKQWDLGAADREAVWQMVKDAKTELRKTDAQATPLDYETLAAGFDQSIIDRAPILKEAPKVEAKMKEGADAADYATAIIRENMTKLDQALEQYRSSIDALINQKDGVVEINGQEYKLDLDKDKIAVPHEEGTGGKLISIRQLLEENADTEADLKAVSVCSTR